MVMKVSEDTDEIAKEVCTLLNIRKRLRKEGENLIPNIQKYGMLVLHDFHQHTKDPQLMAYYVSPMNQMTSLAYISS